MTRPDQHNVRKGVEKRKWTRVGHTLRKPTTNVMRLALEWNPQGERKPGRPKNRRLVAEEMTKHGTTWTEMKKTANNRVR